LANNFFNRPKSPAFFDAGKGMEGVKRQGGCKPPCLLYHLLLNIWVSIHAAKPTESATVNMDATVAIKAIIFLSL